MRKRKMLIGVLTAAMLLGNVSPAMVQGAQAAEVTEVPAETETEELATESAVAETEGEETTETAVTGTEEEETTENVGKTVDAKADENGFIIENGVLTGYTGPGGDVVIPEGVTGIGRNTAHGILEPEDPKYTRLFGDNVTSITIPESVQYIAHDGYYPRYSYGSTFHEACNPFMWCGNLKKFIVEDGNSYFKSINGILYEKETDSETGTEKLTLFVCPQSIEIKNIVIPSNVVEIAAGAFKNCKDIKTVSLPDGVGGFGTETFYECENLEKVIMNTDIISVGDRAFYNCKNLTDISNVEVSGVGKWGFFYCKKIEYVNITGKVIGEYAFYECSSLKEINLSEGLESIYYNAFEGTKATSIMIPASVTYINTDAMHKQTNGRIEYGSGAFTNMWALQKIDVAENNANYKSIDGILYSKDETKLYVCPAAKQGKVIIPNTVQTLEAGIFVGCSKITEVILPDALKQIPESCFQYCRELKKIKIPKSVTDIKDIMGINYDLAWGPEHGTFRACNELQNIDVALDNPNYKSVDNILYNKQGTELYYCPNGKTGNIKVPDGVHTIGEGAFTTGGYDTITIHYQGVIIPDSVTEIKEYNRFTMIYCNPGSYAESYAKEHNIPYKNGLPQANQTITASDFTKTYGDAAFSIDTVTSGDGKLSYVSDNESVAKVDAKGKVTLTGVGTAHITITASETKNYSEAKKVITITVKKKDSAGNTDNNSNLITAKTITKTYGCKAFSIGAKSKSGGKLTYSVADKKVATVDKKGKVTVKGYGQTKITITSAAKGKYPKAKKTITLTVKPVKTKIASVKSAKSKNMVVKWKKDTKATGYVIQYSTDKKFKKGVKTVTITKNKTTSKTIGKLKGGKNYYVRVCTYKKSNGKQIKGSYSAVKSIKVKK